MEEGIGSATTSRVRKRAPNACTRCRQQKIKCSRNIPCEQCVKRSVQCTVDRRSKKVLVTQRYLRQLEQQATGKTRCNNVEPQTPDHDGEDGHDSASNVDSADEQEISRADDLDIDQESDSEQQSQDLNALRISADSRLKNPLNLRNSDALTFDATRRPLFLGVSSNWSFGRRVLSMIYEKVNASPLPPASLLFEGATYDLGWDGRRSTASLDPPSLPTAEFALYLINAVKFHCGRLYHMFDETIFMHHFETFHQNSGDPDSCPQLWYIHYLLILAFGKAFIVRFDKGKKPSGSEYFVHAMQLLPDMLFLYSDPLQSIEILSCAALYLQCLDLRGIAYNLIGQAMRIAVEQGLHTDSRNDHLSESAIQRCREAWWTIFVLDRQMTSLLGAPMSLSDDDITVSLPSFGGSVNKSLALNLHVEVSKATALIQQTVYGGKGDKSGRFLRSMKEALRTLARANDERNQFPLDLKKNAPGIDRLSSYLHLFHHQCLVLATRPLLFSFWQKRLEVSKPLHISSTHGAKSLLRVCVSSAQKSLEILQVLQSQSLLETFIPFDREATFASAVVLCVAAVVDPSLLRNKGPWLDTAYDVLDEMASRGSLLADFHKHELQQLDSNIKIFIAQAIPDVNPVILPKQVPQAPSIPIDPTSPLGDINNEPRYNDSGSNSIIGEWNSEDGLSTQHLLAVADSLDFVDIDWLTNEDFEQSIGIGY